MGKNRGGKRRQKEKEYLVPYDRGGNMVLPIKERYSPYGSGQQRAFGGGFPATPGGNVEPRDRNPSQTLDREVREEMGPFGFKSGGVSDQPVHQHGNMTFREGTVRPKFGNTPDEIRQLPPEYREMERVERINPSTLGVRKSDSRDQILSAVARSVHVDSHSQDFQEWKRTATAEAIYKSILRRLPD